MGKTQKKPKITKTVHGLFFFLQNHKNPETEIFASCDITFEPIKIQTCSAPQNDRLNFSFVKDSLVVGKKMSEKGHLSVLNFGNHQLVKFLRVFFMALYFSTVLIHSSSTSGMKSIDLSIIANIYFLQNKLSGSETGKIQGKNHLGKLLCFSNTMNDSSLKIGHNFRKQCFRN